jgi:hypothetical protein
MNEVNIQATKPKYGQNYFYVSWYFQLYFGVNIMLHFQQYVVRLYHIFLYEYE